MNATSSSATVAVSLFAAVALGMWLRRFVSDRHLSPESKDAVKLAMGLVRISSAPVVSALSEFTK